MGVTVVRPDDEVLARCRSSLNDLKSNLGRVIQGKSDTLDMLIVCLLANGSVLMEDVPGIGKTTLAKALAGSIDATFNRIQFTPDLLPADILGASIYNPKDGSFDFRPGPIFCNVLLADEINRASPRTQSAMLEAMSEMQVTIEGKSRRIEAPFIVLATQNPIEFHGTYPLPEAQLDRFMMRISLGYPDASTEVDILYSQAESHPIDAVVPVLSRETVLEMQQLVRRVEVDRSISEYAVAISNSTRKNSSLKLGASPRGTLMLFRASQAAAFADGRAYVLPDDVQRLAPHVFAHRLVLNTKAKYDGTTKVSVIQDIVNRIPVPT